MRVSTSLFLILGLTILFASPVSAIPNLQLYIEGATYDSETETWVATGTDTVRLWCIGATGDVGSILNVRLAVAYIPDNGAVTVNLTPTQADGDGSYMGVNDPSTPGAPTSLGTHTDGAPQLTDGSYLPDHGIYNQEGVEWQEFGLGDFTLTDSNIGDFIGAFPTELNKDGQINVYEVSISGVDAVHFDLYDTVEGANHAIFAPFSHDAGGGGDIPPVPEPGTVALIGLGTLILAGRGFRGRKK
jgi:hypothetical protein